jgi:hypothetical protein
MAEQPSVTWRQIWKNTAKYPYIKACERIGKKNVPLAAAALLATGSYGAYKFYQEKNPEHKRVLPPKDSGNQAVPAVFLWAVPPDVQPFP